ncbi:hypothetical protein EBS80_04390 [bacterium]|nr:hypothetical protein [bacterium]
MLDKRDLFSGVATVAALGAVAVVHAPVVVVGLVPLAVFVGCRFFLFDSPEPKEEKDTTIEDGLAQARAFAELAKQIRNPRMRERVEHVSERLTRIFERLRRQNRTSADASTFVQMYLPRALEIVRDYVDLANEPELDQASVEKTEQAIDRIADALKELYVKLFDEQMLRLDVANATLEALMDMESPRRNKYPRNKDKEQT